MARRRRGGYVMMLKSLEDAPEVAVIGAVTGLDTFGVIGRLQVLWGWADEQSTAGVAQKISFAWIDQRLRASGFAAAMAEAGWLQATPDGVLFPRWHLHNSLTARERARTAQRVAAHRSHKCNGDAVTNVTVSESLPPYNPLTLTSPDLTRPDLTSSSAPRAGRGGKEDVEEKEPAKADPPANDQATANGERHARRVPRGEAQKGAVAVALEFPVKGGTWVLPASKLEEYRRSFPGLRVVAECLAAAQWLRDHPRNLPDDAEDAAGWLTTWLVKESRKKANGEAAGRSGGPRQSVRERYLGGGKGGPA